MRQLWITLGTIAVASVAVPQSVVQETRFDFGPPVDLIHHQ